VSKQRIIHLTPPSIEPEHIKTKTVCIRAHRERIFQISTQQHNDKLICHNYGHGGAGWTFLFACINESMKQFEQQLIREPELKNKPIVIIGAGCYGQLTAITLARMGHTVRIVAKETDNTASHKAAGFFFPRPRKYSKPAERVIFEALGMESFLIYRDIMLGKHPFIEGGPKMLPAYYSQYIDPGFAPHIAKELLEPAENVTVDFGTSKTYDLIQYKTIFINTPAILQELERNIAELGIDITTQEVDTFDELPESIIFNCAGLGAKKLAPDKRIVPVQGHLINLHNQPNPEQLQYLLNVKVTTQDLGKPRDELIYYAPKESGILGITFKRGQDSLTTNLHEFDRLLLRCRDYFGV